MSTVQKIFSIRGDSVQMFWGMLAQKELIVVHKTGLGSNTFCMVTMV